MTKFAGATTSKFSKAVVKKSEINGDLVPEADILG